MKRYWMRVVSVLLAMCFMAVLAPQPSEASSDRDRNHGYGEDHVLVSLAAGENASDVAARHSSSVLASGVPGDSYYSLAVPKWKSASSFLQEVQSDRSVTSAEPDYTVETVEAQRFSLGFSGQYANPSDSSEAQALYTGQWAASKIKLQEAHALATGSGVVVAILDTGIQPDHPAVAGRLTEARYNFVEMNADPADIRTGIDSDGDGYIDEGAGHGTFISGVVALVAPDAKIMPIRVLNSDGVGTVFAVAQGIRYAVDHGADVINLSLGTTSYSKVLRQAVAYAEWHHVTVVASVGNNSGTSQNEQVMYPARYDGVLAVAAVDQNDVKAPFSNWGRRTDVSAPGTGVFSAYLDGTWAWWSGTSVAAAFVTGESALVKSRNARWDGDDVAHRVESSADNIDRVNSSRYRNKLGEGRINALRSVQ